MYEVNRMEVYIRKRRVSDLHTYNPISANLSNSKQLQSN